VDAAAVVGVDLQQFLKRLFGFLPLLGTNLRVAQRIGVGDQIDQFLLAGFVFAEDQAVGEQFAVGVSVGELEVAVGLVEGADVAAGLGELVTLPGGFERFGRVAHDVGLFDRFGDFGGDLFGRQLGHDLSAAVARTVDQL